MNHVSELHLTSEEKTNLNLLEIMDGRLTRVISPDKLIGSLVLPDSVTEIGDYAFADCSGLTSIVIPDSVTVIGEAAFFGCTGLTTIAVPGSVTAIGNGAFAACVNLMQLTVDNANAVYCGEDNIIYTKDKKSLVAVAAGLKDSIVIPNTVSEICRHAFSGCSGLTGIKLPSCITKIGICVFSRCTSLTGVTIPDTVNVIGSFAFSECTSLTDVIILDSVREIHFFAFSKCTGLTNIVIPDSVTSIGGNAFEEINPNAHFTVKSESVKELLVNSGSHIQDEQITVEPSL